MSKSRSSSITSRRIPSINLHCPRCPGKAVTGNPGWHCSMEPVGIVCPVAHSHSQWCLPMLANLPLTLRYRLGSVMKPASITLNSIPSRCRPHSGCSAPAAVTGWCRAAQAVINRIPRLRKSAPRKFEGGCFFYREVCVTTP